MAKSTKFNYEGAKQEGYSDEEIAQHLSQIYPKFNMQGALDEGYSLSEINQHLSNYKPKKSAAEKGARVVGQYALGAAERVLFPYELATAPMASKEAQQVPYRENIFEDIARLEEQKMMGIPLDEQDEKLYKHLIEQIKEPSKAEEFIQTSDLGVRGLAEKATGLDLQPEGVLEKAASWAGFLKDPRSLFEAKQLGYSPKTIMKAVMPSGTSVMRGLGAGTALEMAEQNDFGPIGTLTAAVVGDIIGGGVAGVAKAAAQPKQTIANITAMFTPKQAKELQKEIINDFRNAGIQADVGTITGSDLVKGIQSKLAQSQYTGKELAKFRDATTENIKEQYKKIADSLGEARFQTLNEAGEVGKEYLTEIRNAEKKRIGNMYSKARQRLEKGVTQSAEVSPVKLIFGIRSLEKALKPGAIKSAEQSAVLDILKRLKSDVFDAEGNVKPAKVIDLINNKVALNEIIDYEVQGGQKQLLKGLVHELDDAIMSYGRKDKEFLKYYAKANKDFAEHAKTFRNDNINKILRSQDPMILMNKMNTVQGMRDLKKALSLTPEGKKAFGDLKRFKLDQMIGNKMADNVTDQLKMGTFANLLKNPKDLQLAKEILGPESLKELMKLQKNVGKLYETAQKFFNASKSGVHVVDTAIIARGVSDLANVLVGNPWPLLKTGGVLAGTRYVAKLMADPEFLRMVEDAVLASSKNDMPRMLQIGKRLEIPIRAAMENTKQASGNMPIGEQL